MEAQVKTHNEHVALAAARIPERSSGGVEEKDDLYQVNLDEDFLTALEYGMPPTAGMVYISFFSICFKFVSPSEELVGVPAYSDGVCFCRAWVLTDW